MTYISIKALGAIIEQTGDNFSNKEQRDFIMQAICKASTMRNEDIAEAALQCLIDVPSLGYQALGEYIGQIG